MATRWIKGKEPPILLVGGVTILVILDIYVFKALIGKDPIVQGGNPYNETDPLPEAQRLHLNRLIEDLRRRRPALVNPKPNPPRHNPVIESGIPGVRMAYMEKPGVFGSEYNWDAEIKQASNHPKGLIGETPVTSTSEHPFNPKTGNSNWTQTMDVARVVRMSPNDYFDLLTTGGYDLPERSAKARWKDSGIDHVMSIVDGLKNGQVMIMPTISFDGRSQEGGHRMEALRQMGHADTPVPVMLLHGEKLPYRVANPYEETLGGMTEKEFFSHKPNPPRHNFVDESTDPFANMFD